MAKQLGGHVRALVGLTIGALALSSLGCANIMASVPDASARAELRSERRHEALLERQRARNAVLNEDKEPDARDFEDLIRDGDNRRTAGDASGALVAYLKAHWADPESRIPPRRIAFLALRHDRQHAEEMFAELIEESPGETMLYVGLGLARIGDGSFAAAEGAFKTALTTDPTYLEAREFLGIAMDRQGRHEEAQAQYRLVRTERPQDVGLLNNLGVSYMLSEDYEEASAVFRHAIDLGTRDVAIYNNLGLALGHLGRWTEALASFRNVGSEGDALNNLGYVLHLKGEYDKAMRVYERALLTNDTNEARVLANIGRLEKGSLH